MKFIHTADWHLGKLVHGRHMTEDQAYVLRQFVQEVEEKQPDFILLAGDIFDRSIPPVEAVKLYEDTLYELVERLGVPVYAISGNHDGPERLQFGSKMMQKSGYTIVGEMTTGIERFKVEDEDGPVWIDLIPYIDPSIARYILQREDIRTFDEAYEALIQTMPFEEHDRHIAVAHAFVTPYGEPDETVTSDSERPLSIGGTEFVQAKHFAPYDYTALGHLHRAHRVSKETIRYSGSLMKYSQSEATHQKGYTLIEMDAAGNVEVEHCPLRPKRDLRVVEATTEELEEMPHSDDYVFVRLLDRHPVYRPMEKVRETFPNALHVSQRANHSLTSTEQKERLKQIEKRDDITLFTSFYEAMYDATPEEEERVLIEQLFDQVEKEERHQ